MPIQFKPGIHSAASRVIAWVQFRKELDNAKGDFVLGEVWFHPKEGNLTFKKIGEFSRVWEVKAFICDHNPEGLPIVNTKKKFEKVLKKLNLNIEETGDEGQWICDQLVCWNLSGTNKRRKS